jgi:hypothetical protein
MEQATIMLITVIEVLTIFISHKICCRFSCITITNMFQAASRRTELKLIGDNLTQVAKKDK